MGQLHPPLDVVDTSLRIRSVWAEDLTTRLNARYLIKGPLYSNSSGVINGAPSCGKTALMIDMVCTLAADLPTWRERRCKKVTVAILAVENARSCEQRVVAWAEHNEIDRGTISLLVVDAQPNLLFDDDVDALIRFLRLEGAKYGGFGLLVLDTFARSMPGGDENSAADVGRVVASLDRIKAALNCSWLAIHHAPKGDSRGLRGSGALLGAVDFAASIADREMVIDKSRDAPIGDRVPFDLVPVVLGRDEDGDTVTAVVATEGASLLRVTATQPPKLSGPSRTALSALVDTIAEGGELLPTTSQIPALTRGIGYEMWREVFYRRYGGPEIENDSKRKAFGRAKDQLLQHELIAMDEVFVWQR